MTTKTGTDSRALSSWYAVVTHPRKEFVVQTLMGRRGIECWFPEKTEYRYQNRYDRGRRKKKERRFPLAPSLVFANLETPENWEELWKMNLLQGVVGINGEPAPIPQKQWDKFRARHHAIYRAAKHRQFMPSNLEFEVGDTVEIIEGALKGQYVRVQKISGRRARVLLSLLGSEDKLDVPLDVLGKAA